MRGGPTASSQVKPQVDPNCRWPRPNAIAKLQAAYYGCGMVKRIRVSCTIGKLKPPSLPFSLISWDPLAHSFDDGYRTLSASNRMTCQVYDVPEHRGVMSSESPCLLVLLIQTIHVTARGPLRRVFQSPVAGGSGLLRRLNSLAPP